MYLLRPTKSQKCLYKLEKKNLKEFFKKRIKKKNIYILKKKKNEKITENYKNNFYLFFIFYGFFLISWYR
jgi:hypothetical protein